MFAVSLLSTLALSALSANAFVVPRTNPPPGYASGYLEDYQVYHTRYLALGCQYQHGKPFFDTCCHPMLATENLKDNRAPECTPSASASASAAAVVATEDCEEEDEPETSSVTPESTPTPTPTPAPAPEPQPTTSDAPSSTATEKHHHAPTSSSAPPPPAESPSSSSSSSDSSSGSSSSGSSSGSSSSGSSSGSSSSGSSSGSSSSGSSSTSSSSGLGDLTGLVTGGFGTFFYQNGVAGACGTVHSDNDLIVAMDTAQYGNTSKQSDLCGKQVQIFNTKNNKSVTCTIADACPTCNNGNSIDMSVAAFQQLASLDEGLINISWKILD